MGSCSRQRDPQEEQRCGSTGGGGTPGNGAHVLEMARKVGQARSCQAVHTLEGGLGLGADRD